MSSVDNYFVLLQTSRGQDRRKYEIEFPYGFISMPAARLAIEKSGKANKIYVIVGLTTRCKVKITREIIRG